MMVTFKGFSGVPVTVILFVECIKKCKHNDHDSSYRKEPPMLHAVFILENDNNVFHVIWN